MRESAALRVVFLILLMLLFFTPGCCGLFQPTERSERAWANREITVGMGRVDAVRIIESHGYSVDYSDAGKIICGPETGQCIDNPCGYVVGVGAIFDSDQRVKQVHVDKIFVIPDVF